MQDYEDIFEQRGSSYDRAMRAYPQARHAEFAQVLAPLNITAGMKIGDVPAGGGYLQTHLPRTCQWLGHEPSSGFTSHGRSMGSQPGSLLPLPWRDGEIDAVVSLAGIHHISCRRSLFTEFARVTRLDGQLVVSDVAEHTAVAHFLDSFVGAWNSTGHEGNYLNEGIHDELRNAGWQVVRSTFNSFYWTFEHRAALVDFTRQLFDISAATPDVVEAAVEEMLGIVSLEEGRVGMNWSLMTVTCSLSSKR